MQVLKLNCGGKEKKYVSKPLGHRRPGCMPLLYLAKSTPFLGDKSFKAGASAIHQPSLYEGQRLEHISSRAQCLCLHREESLMSNYPTNKAAYCIASQAGM